MTRRDVAHWVQRNWWEILVVILVPVVVWGAKRYDASKLDVQAFVVHQLELRQRFVADSLHHKQDDDRTRYLICRIDKRTPRECSHLLP